MIIFTSNLKRILKDRGNLIMMIIFPIIFITLSMSISMGGSKITIGVVDYDKTKFTAMLIDKVKKANTVRYIDEMNIKKTLVDSGADYIMVINKGFTNNIILNRPALIKGYSIMEANTALPTKYYIENFINAAKNIGIASKGSEAVFYKGLIYYNKGSLSAIYKSVKIKGSMNSNILQGLGFLIMSMIFLSNNSAQLILEDKKNKTFYRIFGSPISARNYMLQNVASFFVVLLIQLTFIFTIMKLAFNADFGSSIFNIFGLYAIFSLVCVSLGVAVTSISKDTRQANTINTFITVPMCMLGGCFWPRDFMPDILNKIGNFMPTSWVLKASERIINGDTIFSVGKEISILLLFTLVFILLGSWKKADITK